MTEVLTREELLHLIGKVCERKFQCMHDRLDAGASGMGTTGLSD